MKNVYGYGCNITTFNTITPFLLRNNEKNDETAYTHFAVVRTLINGRKSITAIL